MEKKNKKLAEELNSMKGKEQLDLSRFHQNLFDDGARVVANAITGRKDTSLNLSDNLIGLKEAEPIENTLQATQGRKWTSLNLSGNRIKYNGALEIANALQDPNCELTSLNLSKPT